MRRGENEKNNFLILKSDRTDFEKYYIKQMLGDRVTTQSFYCNMNRWVRYFAIIYIQKLKLPFSHIWYGKWKKELKQYNNIILFDRNYNWNIIDYITKKNPNCRIIVWYWNNLQETKRIPLKYRKFCEEWSFDVEDCKKYNLKYNTQFTFVDDIIAKYKNVDNKYDLCFIGHDKGRLNILLNIKKLFSALNLKVFYVIVQDKRSKTNYSKYEKPISYSENLNITARSNCVLEIVQKGQKGITLRCLEALMLQKKVITNNLELKNEQFYNKNNFLFFEGKNELTINDIEKFLGKEYEPISDTIIHYYDFTEWLDRFEN